VTLGVAPRQADLFRSTVAYCEGRVAPDSIYGILEAYRFRRHLYYAIYAIPVSTPSSYSEGVRYPSPFCIL
jgi:hypothetical protein